MRVNWWPWYGGRDVVINNNIYDNSPCYRSCGSSMFEKLFMFQMINNMLQQSLNTIFHKKADTVPMYPQCFYPGLYLGYGGAEGAGGVQSGAQSVPSADALDSYKQQQILMGMGYKQVQVLSDGTV